MSPALCLFSRSSLSASRRSVCTRRLCSPGSVRGITTPRDHTTCRSRVALREKWPRVLLLNTSLGQLLFYITPGLSEVIFSYCFYQSPSKEYQLADLDECRGLKTLASFAIISTLLRLSRGPESLVLPLHTYPTLPFGLRIRSYPSIARVFLPISISFDSG